MSQETPKERLYPAVKVTLDADCRGGPRFEHKLGRIDRDAEAAKAAPQRPVGVDESQGKSGWGSHDDASHGAHSDIRIDAPGSCTHAPHPYCPCCRLAVRTPST